MLVKKESNVNREIRPLIRIASVISNVELSTYERHFDLPHHIRTMRCQNCISINSISGSKKYLAEATSYDFVK